MKTTATKRISSVKAIKTAKSILECYGYVVGKRVDEAGFGKALVPTDHNKTFFSMREANKFLEKLASQGITELYMTAEKDPLNKGDILYKVCWNS